MYNAKDEKRLYELSKSLLAGNAAMFPEEQVAQLSDVIRYHEWKYYVQNNPVVSDFEYDQLYKKLETLEKEHPDLLSSESPTQRVSSDLTEEFKTVSHIIPMLSLDNSYNLEDLQKFDTQIKKLTGESDIEYVVEPKFDGGSIAVIYENDKLTRGATRGNGAQGEEMTPNARAIRAIPLKAAFSEHGIYKVELRGEAVIRKDYFEKLNKERIEEGLPILANARNSAAGALRTKDPGETAKRGIEAFIFQMGYAVDKQEVDMLPGFVHHEATIHLLEGLGFKVAHRSRKICKTIEEVHDFVKEWELKRDDYPYEIDGMVIKVNDFALQEKCGYTSHHPRWAIAFKFKAKQATSKLLNIEYQIGKIGSITPVAKIEAVQLAGVTVTSVSLHNEDFITGKDIRIGDTVLVERAGDVIPYIVKPMVELRDGSEHPVEFPRECPVCNTPLIRSENEAAWRCPNYDCEERVIQRMIFHVSKDAMDIDGFGYKFIRKFYQLGWLRTLADIYQLDYEQIAALEGFGQKSADKLRTSINKAKKNSIRRFLHSLSVHHLGKRASQLIAERIHHVMDLKSWKIEDYTDIPDIGPVVAENVYDFFHDEKQMAVLEEMEALGVNMIQTEADKPIEVAADAPLIGKTILFTGTLHHMGRKEAQKLAAEAGAKNISAISSNLNILVAGEKAGSKLKKAIALGTVEVMTEEEFLALIGKEINV
ncbi:MAG: DNA ligase (NAD(+)) LigA [Bacteroidetes bacterium]|nr:MAG: DNA ligase (NAD(+)) LigA [Bacteroidota bacterium]